MFRYAEGSGSAALFGQILDLDILSATELICTDYGNKCLRLVNLPQSSAVTSTFAGKCGESGTAGGSRLSTARFSYPEYTEVNNNRTSLFVLESSVTLRVIDLRSDDVTTIFTFSNYGWGINLVGDSLIYLLTHHKVTVFNLDTKEERDVAGAGNEGNAVGSFEQTRFDTPDGLLEWRNGQEVLLFVADKENNRFVKFHYGL